GAFPILWILWAFLTRGGITTRLAGIELMRANGRKVLRVQCAWRSLLVWLPIIGFLAPSGYLDARLLADWASDPARHGLWLYTVSWLAWTAAAALLPIYAALAFWQPARSL